MPTRYGARRWEAWGTYVYLGVSDAAHLDAAEATARGLLGAIDATCSRFRPDSDLSRANRRPGGWVEVDALLVSAVRVALAAAHATDGLVSPCLGRSMVSLGYDTDLRRLHRRAADVLAPPTPEAWREVRVTDEEVLVPDGCDLDLGSTAKAWAADMLATTLADDTGCRVLVSLGGDVRVAGSGDPWPVRVTERPDAGPAQVVRLLAGGLATSSTLVRRWHTQHGEMHHVVDPRTGRPVTGSLRTVTALGETCVAANTATTAALVLGEGAARWLSERDVTARLTHVDGAVTRLGGWPAEVAA